MLPGRAPGELCFRSFWPADSERGGIGKWIADYEKQRKGKSI